MTAAFTLIFLCEEVGWRGYLLPRLATMMGGRWAAVAVGRHPRRVPPATAAPDHDVPECWQPAVSSYPRVMITITAAGVVHTWYCWSSGSIWPVAAMHAAFNQSMGRWSAAVIATATSPAAMAYTTTETGLVTVAIMT